MDFTFSLTRDDFWRLNKYIMMRSFPAALVFWVPAIAYSVLSAVIMSMVTKEAVFIVACVVLPGSLYIVVMIFTCRHKIFSMEMENALLEQAIIICDEGILQTLGEDGKLTAYEDVKKTIINGGDLYIKKKDGSYLILPKRIINGKAQDVMERIKP